MSKHDASAYLENPSAVVDVVRQLVRDLESGRGIPGFDEKNTQLREISGTISKLGAANVPVPDALRRLKMDLVAELLAKEETERKLSVLHAGLIECIGEICSILEKSSGARNGKPSKTRKSSLPTTEQVVLRQLIVDSLHALGGSAHISNVLDHMESLLDGKLLPGDIEKRKGGEIVWRNNACWERFRMVQDGVLKKGSTRGIWELSGGHK